MAVLPVAGLGTRLLPATKEQPKEMLPIFSVMANGELCLKPILHLVFGQLFAEGYRHFVFVVGRGKRVVEDYFTPDWGFVSQLRSMGKTTYAEEMERFYNQIQSSTLAWVNQPEPKGFGHAVLMAEQLAGHDDVLVHAGDTYMLGERAEHLTEMQRVFSSGDADAVLLLEEVPDPRMYGVAEVISSNRGLHVKTVVEKPSKPATNLAIMPVYIFKPDIFRILRRTSPGVGGEIQLTDAIQGMIDEGGNVQAVRLEGSVRLDIGTPKTYWEALAHSYRPSEGGMGR